jgi:hypothetical protein
LGFSEEQYAVAGAFRKTSYIRAIIESSGYKQGMLCKLEDGLNVLYFLTVWRIVASGVDKLIFTRISLETQCLVMVGRKGFMLIGLFPLLFFKHGV